MISLLKLTLNKTLSSRKTLLNSFTSHFLTFSNAHSHINQIGLNSTKFAASLHLTIQLLFQPRQLGVILLLPCHNTLYIHSSVSFSTYTKERKKRKKRKTKYNHTIQQSHHSIFKENWRFIDVFYWYSVMKGMP